MGDAALALAKGDLCALGVVFDPLAFRDARFCDGLYSVSDSKSSDVSSSSSSSLSLSFDFFFLRFTKVLRFLAGDLRAPADDAAAVAPAPLRLRLFVAAVEGVCAAGFATDEALRDFRPTLVGPEATPVESSLVDNDFFSI